MRPNFDNSTPGVPNMKSSAEFIEYCTPSKWLLIQDDEYTSRELAMLYYGYITTDTRFNSPSYADLCVIVKFVASYLENMKVRKFTKLDKVFFTINTYILLHFNLLGQTDVSVSELAGLIRADKEKK